MWTVPKLAWIEFFRSFGLRAPGGRDFMWLTTLLLGLQLLSLLLLSSREGVLERSMDAFLGFEPGYGVPIWVAPNALRTRNAGQIDQALIDHLTEQGFPVAPFRRFAAATKLQLPGAGVWRADTRRRSRDETRFEGLAAETGGPLWPSLPRPGVSGQHGCAGAVPTEEVSEPMIPPPGAAEAGAAPPAPGVVEAGWQLALNCDLMLRYFDLAAYRQALEGRLPAAEFARIPETQDRLFEMDRIWLLLNVHKPVLAPFDVVWTRHIKLGAEQIVFVAPMKLWTMIDVAERNPEEFCLFAEMGPSLGRRVTVLRSDVPMVMSPEQRERLPEIFKAMHRRLGGELELGDDIQGATLRLETAAEHEAFRRGRRCDPGVPEALVAAVAAEAGYDYDPSRLLEVVPNSSPIAVDGHRMSIPCESVFPEEERYSTEGRIGDDCVRSFSLATKGRGYSEALVFASARLDLPSLVEYLRCRPLAGRPPPEERVPLCVDPEIDPEGARPEPRIAINAIYEDSLTRFGFLTRLVDLLSRPMAVVLLGLLTVILVVQLGTVIGHRRVRYGMMLSQGLSWRQIRLILIAQVCIGVILSLSFAVLGFLAIRISIDPGARRLTRAFDSITEGRNLEPLPLDATHVALVGIGVLLVAVIIADALSRFSGVSTRVSLERLLQ